MKRVTAALFFSLLVYACNQCHTKSSHTIVYECTDSLSCNIWSDSLVVIDESLTGLRIYYPCPSVVRWYFADEPDTTMELLCFVCAASYTDKSIYENKAIGKIKHSDIAGKHIYDSILYEGYECSNNTGGFVSYGYNVRKDGKAWDILDRDTYLDACSNEPLPHSAFTQELLIYKGK